MTVKINYSIEDIEDRLPDVGEEMEELSQDFDDLLKRQEDVGGKMDELQKEIDNSKNQAERAHLYKQKSILYKKLEDNAKEALEKIEYRNQLKIELHNMYKFLEAYKETLN